MQRLTTSMPTRETAAAPAECADAALTVLYDGACPLCRREIALYRGIAASQPLSFVDVSNTATSLPAGTHRAQLLARFHVQQPDGTLVDGARGFVALWAVLPGWRWLARLAALPGVTPLMELAYRAFLRLRPLMQRTAAAFEPATLHVPASLVAELRSDHAGETGAVWIYRGVLALSSDADLRSFAPALAGPRAVYATIAAVETFVDEHYQQQLDRIAALPAAEREAATPLRDVLAHCQADECHHRDEAQALRGSPPGGLLRGWCAMVGAGSAAAVSLARRL